MRVALVSPYSYTYPGGVGRHVEALAQELMELGHEVRLLVPYDPDDRIARVTHRGARPQRRPLPDHVVPMGRTLGLPMNGAVSNLATFPKSVGLLGRQLRHGGYDIVHVHEPNAPYLSWYATEAARVPVVATFHTYSTSGLVNRFAASFIGARRLYAKLSARIAVSEAAQWTAQRYYGGRYRIVPNGVDLSAAQPDGLRPNDSLRIVFVGRAEERKGLPVLLRAFEALSEHVPARLTVVGASAADVARHLPDPAAVRVDAIGRVSQDELWGRLHSADVLCAPSLSAESFGMVLIEAFAAGTPVVASAIPGYASVVDDGQNGVLVPAGDPQRLAEELHALYLEPGRRAAMGEAARQSATDYAWPRIADRVESVYETALAAFRRAERGKSDDVRRSSTSRRNAACRWAGFVPVDGSARRPARRLPPLPGEPERPGSAATRARRAGLAMGAVLGAGLAYLALAKIGFDDVVQTIVRSDLNWVLASTALMAASMFLRSESWLAIARAGLPRVPFRRRDVASATMIGVLMSATLPARLGEPARAMVLARHAGHVRATFPVLLGTLVSQTILNLAALAILGAIIVGSTKLFSAGTEQLFVVSAAPLVILAAVLIAPVLLRGRGTGRFARVSNAARTALAKVRSGLRVFRDPRNGPIAAIAQLAAWAVQLLACLVLFDALGLADRPGIGVAAAAAVLFAVNVTAVVPATPSNIGVFQLATVSVLTTGFGVGAADALAYGVILQAVEIATAIALGLPALVREGMTWSDMKLRAIASAPVRLAPGATGGPARSS